MYSDNYDDHFQEVSEVQLIYANERYECFSGFEKKDIPKSAGFRWDAKVKCWYTPSDDIALKLIEYAANGAREKLEEFQSKSKESLEKSYAENSDIEIPRPDGLEYMPFQKAGVDFILQRDKTLLSDSMGLGKSIQSIGVINVLNPNIVTIVCPSSVKINWMRELKKWLTHEKSIEILSGRKKDLYEINGNIRIINYDILDSWLEALSDTEFLILDESQYVKNEKSKRTKAALELSKKAKKILLLTGTPILNRPFELWSQLKMLGSPLGDSWFHFVKRYCNARKTDFGWDVSGATNLEELGQRLRQTVMIRREKEDVLKELPGKRRQIIEVSGNKYKKVLKAEQEAQSGYLKKKRALKRKIRESKVVDELVYKNSVNELRGLETEHFTMLSKLRHETALAKVPDLIEHINMLIEQESKIIVFVHHRDVMDVLKKQYSDICVSVMGGNKIEERQTAIDSFQTNEKTRIFLGSIMAAGTGITLTASSTVVFGELDWTPANITQCEDRAYRIGQQSMVLIHHLVVDGSIDAKMAKMLVRKQNIIDKING